MYFQTKYGGVNLSEATVAEIANVENSDYALISVDGVLYKLTFSDLQSLIGGEGGDYVEYGEEFDEYEVGGKIVMFDNLGKLVQSLLSADQIVSSSQYQTIVGVTQAEYDLLSPPDANTLYVILPEEY